MTRPGKSLQRPLLLTIFAVTDEGMRMNVGDIKLVQLQDQRNEETVLRMAEYHCIANDAVSASTLFASGGVVTVANDVLPVERTKIGGFFFFGGGTEDGGVTVGGSKVMSSVEIANGYAIVHATDNVVSPDQLRIPGSK